MTAPDNHSAGITPGLQRMITGSIFVIGSVFATTVMVIALYFAIQEGVFPLIVKEHFVGVFGPPIATVASMLLVLAFRVVVGPMEFKALGVEFKGASGPVILWCFCFLLQILALSILWKLN